MARGWGGGCYQLLDPAWRLAPGTQKEGAASFTSIPLGPSPRGRRREWSRADPRTSCDPTFTGQRLPGFQGLVPALAWPPQGLQLGAGSVQK